MSPDFFNVDQYPTATFTAASITPAGAKYQVTGNLNLHGVTKSISFPATISISGDAVKINAEIRQRVAAKKYDRVTSGRVFAELLTHDLQVVNHDQHLAVVLAE